MKIQDKIVKIVSIIELAYGAPRPFRKSDPVDELVRTILSQNTNDTNSLRAFGILKKTFRKWNGLAGARTGYIAKLIKSAGLSNIKAARIKAVLREIEKREGRIALGPLKKMAPGDALAYLRSMKGVGPKTAACVLLFSFGMPVMPVDTHIFRVTKRLGLISQDTGREDAHRILQAIVPKHLIYEFHLCIIEHGRRTCRAQNPSCGFCALYTVCAFRSKAVYKEKGKRDT